MRERIRKVLLSLFIDFKLVIIIISTTTTTAAAIIIIKMTIALYLFNLVEIKKREREKKHIQTTNYNKIFFFIPKIFKSIFILFFSYSIILQV